MIIEDDASWFKKLKKKKNASAATLTKKTYVEQSASASKARAAETGLAKVKQRAGPL